MGRLSDQVRCSTVMRGVCAIALALCTINLLTSCNVATTGSTAPGDIDVLDKVRSLDIMPRQAQGVNSAPQNVGERGRAAVFEGKEITELAEARSQPTTSDGSAGGGYDLNFENTPIPTVAKVMIGDILNEGYVIDPRVQGTISLVSVRPVPKSDIAFVLENALRLSGVALLRDNAGYRVAPRSEALGAGRVESATATEPGYGVSVVPLQYVSAQTVMKLMDSFVTKPGSVRADATHNLLLIQGTGSERRAAVDTAMSFDVDAAIRGNPFGQGMLGLMYDKGHGVRRDVVLAYKWLNLAAARAPRRERDYFLRLRNAVASKMSPAQIHEGQRLALIWAPGRP